MKWKRVNEARYDEMLGAVPPVRYEHHGFLVGEPTTHNDRGIPQFQPFMRTRKETLGEYEYFEGMSSMTLTEFREYDRRLIVDNIVTTDDETSERDEPGRQSRDT